MGTDHHRVIASLKEARLQGGSSTDSTRLYVNFDCVAPVMAVSFEMRDGNRGSPGCAYLASKRTHPWSSGLVEPGRRRSDTESFTQTSRAAFLLGGDLRLKRWSNGWRFPRPSDVRAQVGRIQSLPQLLPNPQHHVTRGGASVEIPDGQFVVSLSAQHISGKSPGLASSSCDGVLNHGQGPC